MSLVDTLPANIARDIRQYCEDNRRDLPETSNEAFRMWLNWNGIIGYSSKIRTVLFECITSDPQYLADTDGEREEWLRTHMRVTD